MNAMKVSRSGDDSRVSPACRKRSYLGGEMLGLVLQNISHHGEEFIRAKWFLYCVTSAV